MLKAFIACIGVLSVAAGAAVSPEAAPTSPALAATPLQKTGDSGSDTPKKGAGGAPAKKAPSTSPKKGVPGAAGKS